MLSILQKQIFSESAFLWHFFWKPAAKPPVFLTYFTAPGLVFPPNPRQAPKEQVLCGHGCETKRPRGCEGVSHAGPQPAWRRASFIPFLCGFPAQAKRIKSAFHPMDYLLNSNANSDSGKNKTTPRHVRSAWYLRARPAGRLALFIPFLRGFPARREGERKSPGAVRTRAHPTDHLLHSDASPCAGKKTAPHHVRSASCLQRGPPCHSRKTDLAIGAGAKQSAPTNVGAQFACRPSLLVPLTRLELVCLQRAADFKSAVSAIPPQRRAAIL